jgi:hypothetical protein
MITDGQLFLEPLSGTAITVSATSTNVLDLVANRDLGGGNGMTAPAIVASVLASFASATATATLTIAVQGAPDNGAGSPGGYQTFQATPALPLGMLTAGQRPLKVPLASIAEMPLVPVLANLTTTSGSTSATVSSGTGILDGMAIYGNPNVVPGTTVAAGAGTTSLTLSANASAAGTAIMTAFSAPQPKPRFLRLSYTCSATMTAGSLWAGIVIDDDQPALYPPGYSWPAYA